MAGCLGLRHQSFSYSNLLLNQLWAHTSCAFCPLTPPFCVVQGILLSSNLHTITRAHSSVEVHLTEAQNPQSSSRLKQALDCLNQPGFCLNPAAYAFLLQCCGKLKAQCDGKRIHNHLCKINCDHDPYIGSFLVQMYVKCGALDVAHDLFLSMKCKSVFLCNFMIGAYFQHGFLHEAMKAFEQMVVEGILPDRVTYVHLFSLSICYGTLSQGKRFQACVTYTVFHEDVVVLTALISFYGKGGSMKDAQRVFDGMVKRNVVSWNSIIHTCIQHECEVEALRLFEQLLQEALLPDRATFASIISACAGKIALSTGKKIHTRIAHSKLELDVVVASALISMYGKRGNLEDGFCVFSILPNKNIYSWNAMISAYAQHGYMKEALQLFHLMKQGGVAPDKVTLVSIISIYAKRGQFDDVQCVFQGMSADQCAVCWNAMISASILCGHYNRALEHFHQMQAAKVAPDKVTFCTILSGCASELDIEEGKQIHTYAIYCGYESDSYIGNVLISMYGKCDHVQEAGNVFKSMPLHDIVSWNAMIAAFAQQQMLKETLQIFNQIQSEAIMPDTVTFTSTLEGIQGALADGKRLHALVTQNGRASEDNVVTALVHMYGKCGCLEAARLMFDGLPIQSIAVWNSIISVYSQHGQGKQAIQLFNGMLQTGAMPNKITYLSILSACASVLNFTKGKHIYTYILHSKLDSDVAIKTALINLYSKCGRLLEARKAFNEMPEMDVIAWNTLIASYAQNGCGEDAVKLFFEMLRKGIIPDAITFTNSLSACSHTGLVDDGRSIFNLMSQWYGIRPTVEHYDCLMNLLARAGCLKEVDELIQKMPFKPSMISWTTLLGACRTEADVERGEQAALGMLEMDPSYDSPRLMLSNIYTAAQREEEDADNFIDFFSVSRAQEIASNSSFQVKRMTDEILGQELHFQEEDFCTYLEESSYFSDAPVEFPSGAMNYSTIHEYKPILAAKSFSLSMKDPMLLSVDFFECD